MGRPEDRRVFAIVALLAAGVLSACGAPPCTVDSDCAADSAGYRCDATRGECFESCTDGAGLECTDGAFCSDGDCVAAGAPAASCGSDVECGAGLACNGGICCARGEVCCASDLDCDGEALGARCLTTLAVCERRCGGEDGAGCAPGFHCDTGACFANGAAGAICDESSDCATGLGCESGVCCAGTECCQTHADCGPAFGCDANLFACVTDCTSTGDSGCQADHHCEGTTCVPDGGRGGVCDADADCATPWVCVSGACCSAGDNCCNSDAQCLASKPGYRCDVDGGECFESCGNDDSRCTAGHHCASGACTVDQVVGAGCQESSDCADGLWCRDQLCCPENETCCLNDDDCGTCEKCDPTSFSCVLQSANEDLKEECDESDGSCQTATCSGTGRSCGVKGEGLSCGTCRACDDEGACVTNSTDHGDCPTCQKCASGACVTQDNTEDLKNECKVWPCGDYLYGFDSGTCKTYASATGQNNGLCTTGACPTVAQSCTGIGPNAVRPCADAACDLCPTNGREDVDADVACQAVGNSGTCGGGLMCDATGDCVECVTHDDCGTCEKCDNTGTCVLQTASEDLKDQCEATPNNCTADSCSGTSAACGVKSLGADCGTCRTCDAVGGCQTNSTDHADCDPCLKCDSGGCTSQTSTEDLKNECPALDCRTYVNGMDAGVCKTYDTATAGNGLCNGGGSCTSVSGACQDLGPEIAYSCEGDSECSVCPAGASITELTAGNPDLCERDGARMGCAANATCGPYGTCEPLPSCQAILNNAPGSTDGLYTIDVDGAGLGDPFQVYCDMTTDGGGWTLVANRLPFSDTTGMPDLTAAVGTYNSAQRGNNFQLDVRPLFRISNAAVFASQFGGNRCNGSNLSCYAEVLRVSLVSGSTYQTGCHAAQLASAQKLIGTSAGSYTTYRCENTLGWGDCDGRVCHYGADSQNDANGDFSNTDNVPQQLHVPSAYAPQRSHATCRVCNGGQSTFCCDQESTADEVFTIWLR